MRMLRILDRLERVTLRELETTQREIADIDKGQYQLPDGTSLAEELARLSRYDEYLRDDLDHIRERREQALSIMKGGGDSRTS